MTAEIYHLFLIRSINRKPKNSGPSLYTVVTGLTETQKFHTMRISGGIAAPIKSQTVIRLLEIVRAAFCPLSQRPVFPRSAPHWMTSCRVEPSWAGKNNEACHRDTLGWSWMCTTCMYVGSFCHVMACHVMSCQRGGHVASRVACAWSGDSNQGYELCNLGKKFGVIHVSPPPPLHPCADKDNGE